MIFQTLEWYANEKGYSVMHMPSCLTCCTVGGALAHNGIGILSTKYGKIDDQCLSVEVVLPNGDIINTLPVPKHSSGPNLLSLFLGSEGTLGIMTKARFKMVKLPEVRRHHAFLFDSISTATPLAARSSKQSSPLSCVCSTRRKRCPSSKKSLVSRKKAPL